MEIQNTLCTGTTAKIKKIRRNGKLCVVKMLSIEKRGKDQINKEILIHKSLSHPRIIRALDDYVEGEYHCLIMEYGPFSLRGLIDQAHTTTGSGLPVDIAHQYFVQIIAAVKYMHSKKICHRDIKPDNILVGYQGNIKMTDFGASTLFFYKKFRRLKSIVGSTEFQAPEVFTESYDGALADIWSCGITLINMLTGTLSWKQATPSDERYSAYCSMSYHHYPPFNKLGPQALSLIKGMLKPEQHRYRIADIEAHPWFKQPSKYLDKSGECIDASYLDNAIETGNELYFTQPVGIRSGECFATSSMPVPGTKGASQHRLYLQGAPDKTAPQLRDILESMTVICNLTAQSIVFSTTDIKRNRLTGEIVVQGVGDNSIATITRTSGEVREFQRFIKYLEQFFIN